MKRYEVTREIYNNCSGKYSVDPRFPDEVETDDIEEVLKSWFPGRKLEYEILTMKDGTVVCTIKDNVPERFTFSEF